MATINTQPGCTAQSHYRKTTSRNLLTTSTGAVLVVILVPGCCGLEKYDTRVWPRIRDQATMFILCYRFGCQCPAKTVSIKHIAGQRGTVAGHSVPRPSRRRLFRKKHKFDENKKHEKMLTPILARIAACVQETSKNANPYLSDRFSCARHAGM